MPFGAFAKYFRTHLRNSRIRLYLKNTEPSNEALMSEFDADNMGMMDFFSQPTLEKRKKSVNCLMCCQNYPEMHRLDAWKLREREPDYIPVSVEKDASSDIPDVDMKKYSVSRNILLCEFVDFILIRIWYETPWKKPMIVYFKNTEPPIGTTLMSEVDKKTRDEDGFVHITYSGKESGGWIH